MPERQSAEFSYKGYRGRVEFNPAARSYPWEGHVLGVRQYLVFVSEGLDAAEGEFRKRIDDYLGHCVVFGCEPERPSY